MIHISDALSLAFHSMAAMYKADGKPISAREIAVTTHVSQAHLAKVLQKLALVGLAVATRGPAGGYRLARPGGKITLGEVYAAVEGAVPDNHCVVHRSGGECPFGRCIFRGLLPKLTSDVTDYLNHQTVADLV